MTYLSLFVVDGQTMMVDAEAEPVVKSILEGSYPGQIVYLSFLHGSPFCIRCDQIQGYTISTQESRQAYAKLSEEINADFEDNSNPPWK